ncbi:uncharacterized protein LOC118477835 [Aplysia californica]|uniref:Uncharacterized protein LOC118477835 n=1 Tax=Aplysia californica TaxID=6500 RepID=A0ABM1VUM7_APLCA|nr:uncharacterized protein LOC118477835 [Aplysia californica]
MPRKCCVPGCNTNYDSSVNNERVSVFTFPSDPDRRRLWQHKIPRKDFIPTKQSVVCAKHFTEDCILRVDSFTRAVDRKIPRLSDSAYPTIFPNCPSYLSEPTPVKRKKPEERLKEVENRDEQSFREWMERDKINGFSDVTNKLQAKINDGWLFKYNSEEYCSLYRIEDIPSSKPSLLVAIRIFKDMHVEVFSLSSSTLVRVADSSLTWLFGKPSPLLLTTWSQFDSLISYFSQNNDVVTKDVDIKERIQVFTDGLQKLCSDTMDNDIDSESEDKQSLRFLVEQLHLLTSPVKRYSSETLLWAFQILATAPTTYSMLRSSLA